MITPLPISGVVSLRSCNKTLFFSSLLHDPLAALQRGAKQLWYLLSEADAFLFLSSTY